VAETDKLDAKIELDASPEAVSELIANDRDELEDDKAEPEPGPEPEPKPETEPETGPVVGIVPIPIVPVVDAGRVTDRSQPIAWVDDAAGAVGGATTVAWAGRLVANGVGSVERVVSITVAECKALVSGGSLPFTRTVGSLSYSFTSVSTRCAEVGGMVGVTRDKTRLAVDGSDGRDDHDNDDGDGIDEPNNDDPNAAIDPNTADAWRIAVPTVAIDDDDDDDDSDIDNDDNDRMPVVVPVSPVSIPRALVAASVLSDTIGVVTGGDAVGIGIGVGVVVVAAAARGTDAVAEAAEETEAERGAPQQQ
jgi:hypothetical protein